MPKIKGIEIGKSSQDGRPGIEKFFDILEEVKKEEQTTIGDCCVCAHQPKRQLKGRYETS